MIKGEGLLAILKSLKNRDFESLDLEDCDIEMVFSGECDLVEEMLQKNCFIHYLNLLKNPITEQTVVIDKIE